MKKIILALSVLVLVACGKQENSATEQNNYEKTTSYACSYEGEDVGQKCGWSSGTCNEYRRGHFSCVSNIGETCDVYRNLEKDKHVSGSCKLQALEDSNIEWNSLVF